MELGRHAQQLFLQDAVLLQRLEFAQHQLPPFDLVGIVPAQLGGHDGGELLTERGVSSAKGSRAEHAEIQLLEMLPELAAGDEEVDFRLAIAVETFAVVLDLDQMFLQTFVVQEGQVRKLLAGHQPRARHGAVIVDLAATDAQPAALNELDRSLRRDGMGGDPPAFARPLNGIVDARVAGREKPHAMFGKEFLQQVVRFESQVHLLRIRTDLDEVMPEEKVYGTGPERFSLFLAQRRFPSLLPRLHDAVHISRPLADVDPRQRHQRLACGKNRGHLGLQRSWFTGNLGVGAKEFQSHRSVSPSETQWVHCLLAAGPGLIAHVVAVRQE